MFPDMVEVALDLIFGQNFVERGDSKVEEWCSPKVTSVVRHLSYICAREGSVVIPSSSMPEAEFYCFEDLTEHTMEVYVQRLLNMYNCSDSSLCMAIVYMHRVESMCPWLKVNQFNVKNMFSVALTLATKFNEDIVYRNSYYAQLCDLELKKFNRLEMTMLQAMNFKLCISPEEFEDCEDAVYA